MRLQLLHQFLHRYSCSLEAGNMRLIMSRQSKEQHRCCRQRLINTLVVGFDLQELAVEIEFLVVPGVALWQVKRIQAYSKASAQAVLGVAQE